jgi:hypothetical protein
LSAAFRKISSIRNLTGATTWYLSDDCLLAAKRAMYSVEYRRFYLRDLESIVVWRSPVWLLRPATPGVILLVLGGVLWQSVNFTAGAIAGGMGLAWAGLELALGPMARSRIRTTGASVDLPIAARTGRARKVLAKIDAAVRATRGSALEQSAAAMQQLRPATPASEIKPESMSAAARIGEVT